MNDTAPHDLEVTVRLDGGDSYDPEEDTLTYAWTLMSSPSGSGAKLINSTWADPEIFIDKDGTYEVMLTVSDGALSDTDTVIISATRPNDAPTASSTRKTAADTARPQRS